MATVIKLRSDIKKLKKAIETKGISDSIKSKLKVQLEKVENELAAMQKGGKPRKVSTTKGTATALSALQKLIKRKKYGVYQGKGVDLKKDANEGAMATGRRVSKGLKANQFGSKGENKGNVYYEYRPNRLDVKQPRKAQRYPKLEKGGEIESGAKRLADNPNWTNEKLKDSYDELTQTKKDFEAGKVKPSKIIGGGYKSSAIAKKVAKNWLEDQIERYKLALELRGVMMAKGGELSQFRIIPNKKIEIKGSPDLVEPYYSLAFTVNGSLHEANQKAQDFVKNNPEIITATVTKIHSSGNPLKNKKVSYVTKDEIQKFEEGGEIHSPEDDEEHYAMGGMVAGRYYKDSAGNELRFIGESGGMGLFRDKDGNAIKKDFSDFIKAPKESKLFGWFEKGGEIKIVEDVYGKSAFIPYMGKNFLVEWTKEKPMKDDVMISDNSFKLIDSNSTTFRNILGTLLKAISEKKVVYLEKGGYNTGAGWTLDRARHNKSEDYEIPMNKRKLEDGGVISKTHRIG